MAKDIKHDFPATLEQISLTTLLQSKLILIESQRCRSVLQSQTKRYSTLAEQIFLTTLLQSKLI